MTTWEPWSNGMNQSEIACRLPQCDPTPHWGGILPPSYQGYFLLVLLVVMVVGFVYFLIVVGVGKKEKIETPPEPPQEPRSKGKRK